MKKSISTWKESLVNLKNDGLLSISGVQIAKKIITDGRIIMHSFSNDKKPFPILDVHQFLNHKVDSRLIDTIGKDLARKLKQYKPELILTAASSGIAPAQVTAFYLGKLPYIFAKKAASSAFIDGSYMATSFSITERHNIELYISKICLKPNTRVIILDDFLDKAILAENLAKIVKKARCNLVGMGFVIEKASSRGRQRLKKYLPDSKIHSLLKINKIQKNEILIEGIPYFLRLKNTVE